ncbi:hypothetical protein GCM10008107_22460 [Psychrosphaera saromensis]|uniref:DUF3703 domain-containing protein n=1 Tax=Psychrosphaera saromensis TaxID=716813 RepID=A0A2S7UQP8_9GAMM|nr:DUF3703 domain-containing protein [Psychrosphaera saromensis]PQJ52296.1 hypothetical protein BTO11_00570 [Psychrosphaera saromensis]GHB72570.1 hypothetical protein GCM10008107_22460 [Psychrosphaera saromensis]GLQ13550.1 hypothetical protein GCM10007917_10050 [Psychrosphaera saromensis]
MNSTFTKNIKPFVDAELQLASIAYSQADKVNAFKHLENAHVIGQNSTYLHVKVHCLMFVWALKERKLKELLGQIMRIFGAATKTAIGLVPEGNTGGANVSPFKVMPISTEHAHYIKTAKMTK